MSSLGIALECSWRNGYALLVRVFRDVLLQPLCHLALLRKMRVPHPLPFYLQFCFSGHSCLHWVQLTKTCIFCVFLLSHFPHPSPPPVPVTPRYYIFWLLFRATTSGKRDNIVILEQYEKGDRTFFHRGGWGNSTVQPDVVSAMCTGEKIHNFIEKLLPFVALTGMQN